MSSVPGSTALAMQKWAAKKGKSTPLGVAMGLAQQYAVPVAVLGFLLRRFLKNRKQAAAKKSDANAKDANAASSSTVRKPRREYKVKRDQEPQPLLVGADDEEVEIQPHDNVIEAFTETEVEKAGAAASGPGGSNTAMLQMLQQMGYKIVMPKDGSGQVFLVPPGAQAPGGQAIEEGDEEGYDEDEDGYVEGDDDEEEDE